MTPLIDGLFSSLFPDVDVEAKTRDLWANELSKSPPPKKKFQKIIKKLSMVGPPKREKNEPIRFQFRFWFSGIYFIGSLRPALILWRLRSFT